MQIIVILFCLFAPLFFTNGCVGTQENQVSLQRVGPLDNNLSKQEERQRNYEYQQAQNSLHLSPEGPSVNRKTYINLGSGHWITKNIEQGKFIMLEDGSLWEVSPIDRIYSMLWLPIAEISVLETQNPFYSYTLVNTDDGEKVEAKLILGTTNVERAPQGLPLASDNVIESRIDGEFEGWDGETVFKLTNGQIWQQTSYSYTYHYAYVPKVFIYKTTGGYKMTVEGVRGSIYVKRLK